MLDPYPLPHARMPSEAASTTTSLPARNWRIRRGTAPVSGRALLTGARTYRNATFTPGEAHYIPCPADGQTYGRENSCMAATAASHPACQPPSQPYAASADSHDGGSGGSGGSGASGRPVRRPTGACSAACNRSFSSHDMVINSTRRQPCRPFRCLSMSLSPPPVSDAYDVSVKSWSGDSDAYA